MLVNGMVVMISEICVSSWWRSLLPAAMGLQLTIFGKTQFEKKGGFYDKLSQMLTSPSILLKIQIWEGGGGLCVSSWSSASTCAQVNLRDPQANSGMTRCWTRRKRAGGQSTCQDRGMRTTALQAKRRFWCAFVCSLYSRRRAGKESFKHQKLERPGLEH